MTFATDLHFVRAPFVHSFHIFFLYSILLYCTTKTSVILAFCINITWCYFVVVVFFCFFFCFGCECECQFSQKGTRDLQQLHYIHPATVSFYIFFLLLLKYCVNHPRQAEDQENTDCLNSGAYKDQAVQRPAFRVLSCTDETTNHKNSIICL